MLSFFSPLSTPIKKRWSDSEEADSDGEGGGSGSDGGGQGVSADDAASDKDSVNAASDIDLESGDGREPGLSTALPLAPHYPSSSVGREGSAGVARVEGGGSGGGGGGGRYEWMGRR